MLSQLKSSSGRSLADDFKSFERQERELKNELEKIKNIRDGFQDKQKDLMASIRYEKAELLK
jgi:hypothetical protein